MSYINISIPGTTASFNINATSPISTTMNYSSSSLVITLSEAQKNIYWYIIWEREKSKFKEYENSLGTLQGMLNGEASDRQLALEYIKNTSTIIYDLLTTNDEESVYNQYFSMTYKQLI